MRDFNEEGNEEVQNGLFYYERLNSVGLFLTAFLCSFFCVILHRLPLVACIVLCVMLGLVIFFMGMVVGVCKNFEEVQLAKSRLLVSEMERKKENEKKSHID